VEIRVLNLQGKRIREIARMIGVIAQHGAPLSVGGGIAALPA
jgi:hypothetical protein